MKVRFDRARYHKGWVCISFAEDPDRKLAFTVKVVIITTLIEGGDAV